MSTKEQSLASLTESIGEKESSGKRKPEPYLPPPTPKKANPVEKAVAMEAIKSLKKEADDDERALLYRKVTEYLRSPYLAPLIPKDIKAPSEKATVAELKGIYASIKGALLGEAKRSFVLNMFDNVVADGGEYFFLNFLQDSSKLGLSNYLKSNKELFQPELEELAIELSDNYIPGPQARIVLKLISFVQGYNKFKAFNEKDEEKE
jgi:hypothetical protein